MQSTMYDAAGGWPAMVALARAHHARCLADPELNHPFSHPDQHPEHIERLAAYLTEAWGGPASYSALGVDQSTVLALHAGHGDMSDLGRRFVECFLAAADDAHLPDDPDFRTAMRRYMEGAVGEVALPYPDSADAIPAGLPVPVWAGAMLEPVSEDLDHR
jgi:hemoglobin